MKLKYTDKYGFTGDVSFMDAVLHGFGANTIQTPEQRLLEYIKTTQSQAQNPPPAAPAQNPMTAINPYYTRQQPSNSLDPTALYQNYKQTGQIPAQQSSFRPYTAPQAPQAPTAAAPTASAQPVTGGK